MTEQENCFQTDEKIVKLLLKQKKPTFNLPNTGTQEIILNEGPCILNDILMQTENSIKITEDTPVDH